MTFCKKLKQMGSLWVSMLVTLAVIPSGAEGLSCQRLFFTSQHARTWGELERLTLMTFNVANIFEMRGKYERVSATDLRPVPGKPPRPKDDKHVSELKELIDEIDPDIAVLTEVEGLEALHRLGQKLKSPYRSYLVHGNDQRNIDIGLMVKADLNVYVEVHSHREHIWRDPVTLKKSPLFTRDLPVFLLRRETENHPFMIVVGVHAISRRGRPGDPHSNLLRAAQFHQASQIIRQYQHDYGRNTPIMIAGDFNTDVQLAPEMLPLKEISMSAFDMALETIPKAARVTHTFHERARVPKEDHPQELEEIEINHMMQLDDIRFAGLPSQAVLSARVHRYKDELGHVRPFALSWSERQTQTSDHLPVVVDVSAAPFQSALTKRRK